MRLRDAEKDAAHALRRLRSLSGRYAFWSALPDPTGPVSREQRATDRRWAPGGVSGRRPRKA